MKPEQNVGFRWNYQTDYFDHCNDILTEVLAAFGSAFKW